MVCNREMKQVNGGHIKSHGITTIQYKEMFPDAVLIQVSDKHREAARNLCIERNRSEEGKARLAERNKTPQMRNKVSEALTGKEKSEEHKEALKEAKANEDPKHRAKVNGDNRRGKKHTKETIERIARNSAQHEHPVGIKHGIRKDLGHNCRGTWEANIARVLKRLEIEYEYENIIWMKRDDGSDLSYMPDFYLPKYDSYIEVKGRWYDDAREKFELFKKRYPDTKMHLMELKQYLKYTKRYKSFIEEWE